MKFSDLIHVRKTVPANSKGWQTIDQIAKELGVGADYASIKVKGLVKSGRVEEARIDGCNRKAYRIIK